MLATSIKPTTIRYFCTCSACGHKWVEDLLAVNDHVTEYWGKKHLAECEKLNAIYTERLNYNLAHRRYMVPFGAEQDADYQTRIVHIIAKRLNWKRLPEPTKCDGRCMNATGHNCDCQCGGENHGRNHLC